MNQNEMNSRPGQFLQRYAFLIMFAITFLYGLAMPDRGTLITDLHKIITSPSLLTHDFLAVAGLSATFVNVSLHFLVGFLLVTLPNPAPLKGVQIAAVGFYAGHAFFGSHIMNIIPPILGVYLYSFYANQPFKQNATLAIFANTLGPISSIIWNLGAFSPLAIFLGGLAGVFCGFISVPLAGKTAQFHNGMTLLNYGYVAGLIGIVFVTLMGQFGYAIEPVAHLYDGSQWYLVGYLVLVAALFIALGLSDRDGLKIHYPELLREAGIAGTDFLAKYPNNVSLFNMGVMIMLSLLIVQATGFTMNGTIIGGIFALVAFCAFGAHPRNTLPPMIGVLVGAFLTGTPLASQGVVLPLLFSFGLAPFAGKYGFVVGLLAGFMHYAFLSKALAMHMGSILYNNGFSTGFLAIFLLPIVEVIVHRPKKVQQDI